MRVYCIYFPNNKRYVGVETRPKSRFRYYKYGYGHALVGRAIKKYGFENCKFEYLSEEISSEEGWELEKKLIKDWCLTDPKKGYNCSIGGEKGSLGVKQTLKQKLKRSISLSGRKLSEEHKSKISKSLLGHTLSEKSRQKISEKNRGRTPWNFSKKGVCKPNKTSFKKGGIAPNKGRKRKIIDGKVRYIFVSETP